MSEAVWGPVLGVGVLLVLVGVTWGAWLAVLGLVLAWVDHEGGR